MNSMLKRRDIIKGLSIGMGGLALGNSPVVLSALAAESEPVDTMIIGSGFGGAVAALRLAEQGIHTVLLERGKRWPVNSGQNTFSSLLSPDGRSAWLRDHSILGHPTIIDRYIGVLDLSIENGIASLAGAGLGGGSLVYAAALYQPSERLFNKTFEGSVDYREMDSMYFARARSVLNATPIPSRMLDQAEYAAARSWLQLGTKAGLSVRRLDMGLSWDTVWQELQGRSVKSVVSGEFWYGNNSGAKLSLDKNYLSQAENTGYLDIQTQQNVTSIALGPDGRYIVTSNEIDQNGFTLSTRKFVVKKLLMAAGSLATSKLLVKAKGRGEMPGLNEHVGRHWGNNGDFFSGIGGLAPSIKPNLGGTAPIAIEDHDNPILPTAVECYADWTLAGQTGLISSIGMTTCPASGYFSYNATTDEVQLNWPGSSPEMENMINAGMHTYTKLARHSGLNEKDVKRAEAGFFKKTFPVTASVTAHPLGGVVLGRATDGIGTVRNYNNLYVLDGALIPGHTGCTNPALTIAALAERNIEKIILRDF